MPNSILGLAALLALASVAVASNVTTDGVAVDAKAPAVSNSKTSITQFFQNNLNYTDDANHLSVLLLDPMAYNAGVLACAALGETPLSKAVAQANKSDLANLLNYNAFAGRADPNQAYYIDNTVLAYQQGASGFVFSGLGKYEGQSLPVLCTQSAEATQPGSSTASASNQVSINAAGNTIIGFRNKKSFRFLGIPYANQTARFEYSTISNVTGETLQATAYGSGCPQYGSGSENCLFMNIQTPYLPKAGTKKNLRPVQFWIHGGGFEGGSGSDPQTDGGNLASREDIVTVTFNYRIGTLGFLAIPGTDIKGNFGIGDQVNALDWVLANIASFGGDPKQITITGESAGAASVRVHLGSAQSIGKFQGAIAMSDLGGGQDLGEPSNYGTQFTNYYTIDQSYAVAGQSIFHAVGCNQTAITDQITCLRTASTGVVINALRPDARYIVQDGTFVTRQSLDLRSRSSHTAHVPYIGGNVLNDGASFTGLSTTCTSLADCLAANIPCTPAYANAIIASGLFPYVNSTGNLQQDAFNVSQRVVTDNMFRCVDQATSYAGAVSGAFSSAYYYQMNQAGFGYNPNNVPAAGPSPHYLLHGSDMPWLFGNQISYTDPKAFPTQLVTTTYFAEFMRSGQPNPSEAYLMARGYKDALKVYRRSGPWNEVTGDSGNQVKQMDYPAYDSKWVDAPQCAWLNYSISYYLTGGV